MTQVFRYTDRAALEGSAWAVYVRNFYTYLGPILSRRGHFCQIKSLNIGVGKVCLISYSFCLTSSSVCLASCSISLMCYSFYLPSPNLKKIKCPTSWVSSFVPKCRQPFIPVLGLMLTENCN